jgi:hypothetical protein
MSLSSICRSIRFPIEEVLQELIDQMSAKGIEPLGALEFVPSLVENRIWRAPESAEKMNASDQPVGVRGALSPRSRERLQGSRNGRFHTGVGGLKLRQS